MHVSFVMLTCYVQLMTRVEKMLQADRSVRIVYVLIPSAWGDLWNYEFMISFILKHKEYIILMLVLSVQMQYQLSIVTVCSQITKYARLTLPSYIYNPGWCLQVPIDQFGFEVLILAIVTLYWSNPCILVLRGPSWSSSHHFSWQDFVGVKNALHDHDDRNKQSTHMDDIWISFTPIYPWFPLTFGSNNFFIPDIASMTSEPLLYNKALAFITPT